MPLAAFAICSNVMLVWQLVHTMSSVRNESPLRAVGFVGSVGSGEFQYLVVPSRVTLSVAFKAVGLIRKRCVRLSPNGPTATPATALPEVFSGIWQSMHSRKSPMAPRIRTLGAFGKTGLFF